MGKLSNRNQQQSSISSKSRVVSNNWITFLRSNDKIPTFKVRPTKIKHRAKPAPSKTSKHSKVIALDCEMVSDENGQDMLARVALVDFNLACVYDKYVKPTAPVGDYRTRFSGIRAEDIENGADFNEVRKEVKELLFNKFLVGHAVRHDLKVLQFGHHAKLIRDTSLYTPFREISNGKTPSLRRLAKHFLNESIQEGEHSPIQDAEAAMKLYRKFRHDWEVSLLCGSKNNADSSQTQASINE